MINGKELRRLEVEGVTEDFAEFNKPFNIVTLSDSEESCKCRRSFATAQDNMLKVTGPVKEVNYAKFATRK